MKRNEKMFLKKYVICSHAVAGEKIYTLKSWAWILGSSQAWVLCLGFFCVLGISDVARGAGGLRPWFLEKKFWKKNVVF